MSPTPPLGPSRTMVLARRHTPSRFLSCSLKLFGTLPSSMISLCGRRMGHNHLCGAKATRKLCFLKKVINADEHRTGLASHGDYVFGWKGDSLQKAMDANCNINCPQLKTQTIAQANKCVKNSVVKEDIDTCKLLSRLLISSDGCH